MADAFTISLLPVPLAFVHIPRTRFPALSHHVLRHILYPSPTFLTITANQIEVSLLVDWAHAHDFEVIARKDRRSMRHDPVEISYEPWSVLQVDSHADQYDNSGARVNELSGPLATAGISIFYQSSYMCDFIFVKESRLHEALTLFETAGFNLYTSNMTPVPSYPPMSPYSPSSPTVLTLASSVNLSHSSSTPTNIPNGRTSIQHLNELPKSHSPAVVEVITLEPDLACVGLSNEFGVDHWGLKIVKLVAFPELIPSSRSFMFSPPSLLENEDDDEYLSYSLLPTSFATGLNSSTRTQQALPPADTVSSVTVPASSSLFPTMSSSDTSNNTSSSSHRKSRKSSSSSLALVVPFFTFTRTQEGSSLTADVKTLAALFQPEERHLLVCCNSLEFKSSLNEDEGIDKLTGGMEELHLPEERDGCLNIGELKCLQIDLRRFGLDKYGLVSRFSRVLGENGVNHMYSSTFKTANILVNKRHVGKAQALLRGCY